MSGLNFIRSVMILYFYVVSCHICANAMNVSMPDFFQQPNIKVKLISLEKCKLHSGKVFKNVSVTYSLAARKVDRKTTLISTFVSVEAKEGPIFFNIRGYQVQQTSARDLILNIEKLSCSNPMTLRMTKVFKLKLDSSCYALPGNYSSDNIKIDELSWIFSKTIVGSGQYAYDLEFATSKGVAVCIALTCEIRK